MPVKPGCPDGGLLRRRESYAATSLKILPMTFRMKAMLRQDGGSEACSYGFAGDCRRRSGAGSLPELR